MQILIAFYLKLGFLVCKSEQGTKKIVPTANIGSEKEILQKEQQSNVVVHISNYSELYQLLNKLNGINYLVYEALPNRIPPSLEREQQKVREKLLNKIESLQEKVELILKISSNIIDLYRHLQALRFALARKCLVEFEEKEKKENFIKWYESYRVKHPLITKPIKDGPLYKITYQNCVLALTDSKRSLEHLDKSAAEAALKKMLAESEQKLYHKLDSAAESAQKAVDEVVKNAIENAKQQALIQLALSQSRNAVKKTKEDLVDRMERKKRSNDEPTETDLDPLALTRKAFRKIQTAVKDAIKIAFKEAQEVEGPNAAKLNKFLKSPVKGQLESAIYEAINWAIETVKKNKKQMIRENVQEVMSSVHKDIQKALWEAAFQASNLAFFKKINMDVQAATVEAKKQSTRVSQAIFDGIQIGENRVGEEDHLKGSKELVEEKDWNQVRAVESKLKLYKTDILRLSKNFHLGSKNFRHPSFVIDGIEIDFSFRGVRLAKEYALTGSELMNEVTLPKLYVSHKQIQEALDSIATEEFNFRKNDYVNNNCNHFMEKFIKKMLDFMRENIEKNEKMNVKKEEEQIVFTKEDADFAKFWPKDLDKSLFVELTQDYMSHVTRPIIKQQNKLELFLPSLYKLIDLGYNNGSVKKNEKLLKLEENSIESLEKLFSAKKMKVLLKMRLPYMGTLKLGRKSINSVGNLDKKKEDKSFSLSGTKRHGSEPVRG